MQESRREKRERCFARALLTNLGTWGHVSEISSIGLRVRMPGVPKRLPEEQEILIVSLNDVGIAPFTLAASMVWRQDEPDATILGFKISGFADPECKDRFGELLEYYRSED